MEPSERSSLLAIYSLWDLNQFDLASGSLVSLLSYPHYVCCNQSATYYGSDIPTCRAGWLVLAAVTPTLRFTAETTVQGVTVGTD